MGGSRNKDIAIPYDKEYRKKNKTKISIKRKYRYKRDKEYIAARNRYINYGVTTEQYQDMLDKAEGKCVICQRLTEKLNIDHDHTSGKVRDLLCSNCNKGLGFFQDDASILEAAIQYLERHNLTNE